MPYGKDMSKIYFKMTTMELRTLRAKKIRKLEKLRQYNSYFAKQDRRVLAHQIDQLDAVLEAREAQTNYLE